MSQRRAELIYDKNGFRLVDRFDETAADELIVESDDAHADTVHVSLKVTYIVSPDDLYDATMMMSSADLRAFGQACVDFVDQHREP